MNWLQRLIARRWLRQEFTDEVQSHLDEKIDALIADGMSREEAVFAARRAFGNVALTVDHGRDVWVWPTFDTWWTDLRHALRQLRKAPGITVTALLSSALGMGAATGLFSIVYGVLINPYPYANVDRIVHLHVFSKGALLYDLPLLHRQFEEFRRSPLVDGAMSMDTEIKADTSEDLPGQVTAAYLSADAFTFLGVPPLTGRVFSSDATGTPPNPRQIVLSHRYWTSRYAARPDVVGQTAELDHKSYTIIGIMPPRFTWGDSDVYAPMDRLSIFQDRPASVYARLKPGMSDADAQRDLQLLVEQLAGRSSSAPSASLPSGFELRVLRMRDIAAGPISGVLTVTGAAVGLLLLVGCANVSILLLVKGTTKARELAIRVAVGASRGRLVRQLLAESMLISFGGAALGVALAYRVIRIIPSFLPAGAFPSEAVVDVNVPVLLFSASVAAITGLLFGLAPSLNLSHPELGTITHAGPSTEIAHGTNNTHYLLIVTQVALTVVLLAGAGATLRGLDALFSTPLNYEPEQLASVRIDLRDGAYTTWHDRVEYFMRARDAAAKVPGVESAAVTIGDLPPTPPFHSSRVVLPNRKTDTEQAVLVSKISGEYFGALHIPILSGRTWTDTETAQAAHVAVVNKAMAERYWPGTDPLWQRVFLPDLRSSTSWAVEAPWQNGWVEVVGVAADAPNTGLKDPVAPAIYVPFTLVTDDSFRLAVRGAGSPIAIARGVALAVHDLDPDQPVSELPPATELLASQGWARERFTASLFGAFACLAVLLSAAGLYSVVSYVVARRTQEFGIRMALGAEPREMMRTVWAVAMSPTVLGISVGLGLCRALDTVMLSWTRESAVDPYVLLPVVAVLLVASTLAAFLPALRAARLNPMTVLRGD